MEKAHTIEVFSKVQSWRLKCAKFLRWYFSGIVNVNRTFCETSSIWFWKSTSISVF